MSSRIYKQRRSIVVGILVSLLILLNINTNVLDSFPINEPVVPDETSVLSEQVNNETGELAKVVLDSLEVRGRAPKTGYKRDQFSNGWATIGSCDVRNVILARGMQDVVLAKDGCIVLSGRLDDKYTGKVINFVRGSTTSAEVQIDHVVALSDAWQKGAQSIGDVERFKIANDPLNLLPVDGPANQQKGDSDAASWLPSNKGYRCRYVARQIAVKSKYSLWVSSAEKTAISRILNGCGDQRIPVENQ